MATKFRKLSLTCLLVSVVKLMTGKLKPSTSDISIFNRIKKACKLLEIQYLDNLIISVEGKYSFADENVV